MNQLSFKFSRFLLLFALIIGGFCLLMSCSTNMPGRSFSGNPPANTPEIPALSKELQGYMQDVISSVGQRNIFLPQNLDRSADLIESYLKSFGYTVDRQVYTVRNIDCYNLVAEKKGTTLPDEIVVIGAHYDSMFGTVGANDNGSGTVANMALAKHFSKIETDRTLRFVFFTNEEPPNFQQPTMGSLVYARDIFDKEEHVVVMYSLETMGYFTDEPNSQKVPVLLKPFYPSTGNFIAFVSNRASSDVLKQSVASFRERVDFPSRGGALPTSIPGVSWSDHWSFWQIDVPGIMVTDTALMRYPHYHEVTDTADKVDFDSLARVVTGLKQVIEDQATQAP